MKTKILISLLALIFISCNKEERLIDNSVNANDIYIANSETNEVSIYEFPAMTLLVDKLLESNGVDISSNISNIREFQGKVYILVPDESKMFVFDSEADTLIKTNEFPNSSGPNDISFSNIADGFVTFKNAPYVANYDLVYNEIVRYIDGGSVINSINSAGSFVYLTEPQSSSVSVIDIRNYRESNQIDLPIPPTVSSITSGNELLVVSNRISNENNQIPAQIHYINTGSNTLRESFEFGDARINANNLESYDILSTSLSYTFVATNLGYIRIDNRVDNRFAIITERQFEQIEYGPNFESILLLERNEDNSNLVISNSKSGAIVDEVSLPANTNRFMIQQ